MNFRIVLPLSILTSLVGGGRGRLAPLALVSKAPRVPVCEPGRSDRTGHQGEGPLVSRSRTKEQAPKLGLEPEKKE